MEGFTGRRELRRKFNDEQYSAIVSGTERPAQGDGREAELPWELPRYRNWLAVARVNRSVQRELGRAIDDLGVDLARFDVLASVFREPGLAQGELAGRLLVGRSNLSMLLPDLERRGLVVREDDPGDARVRRLSVTPAGERLARRGLARQAALVRHVLDALTEAECEALGDMMRRIGHHLEDSPFEPASEDRGAAP